MKTTCVVHTAGAMCWGDCDNNICGVHDTQPSPFSNSIYGEDRKYTCKGSCTVTGSDGVANDCSSASSKKCQEQCDDQDLNGCSTQPRIALKPGSFLQQIAVGETYACGIQYDGQVICWGDCDNEDFNNRHACGAGENDEMRDDAKHFTKNDDFWRAISGYGGLTFDSYPNLHSSFSAYNNGRGQYPHGSHTIAQDGDPGSMTIHLGTDRYAKFIAAGKLSTCVILDNDEMKCWGRCVVGATAIIPMLCPRQRKWDKRYTNYWDMGDFGANTGASQEASLGDNPLWTAADFGTADGTATGTQLVAKWIIQREYGGCAILSNDRLKCWGIVANYHTVLRSSTGTGESNVQTLKKANEWPYFPLGTEDGTDSGTPHTVKKMACGIASDSSSYSSNSYSYETCCVVLGNNRIKCWGYNKYGQLGQGDTTDRSTDATLGNNLDYVDLGTDDGYATGTALESIDVAVGWGAVCALISNGRMKCWGNNKYAALGNSNQRTTSDHLGDAADEMGNNDLDYVDFGTDANGAHLTATQIVGAGKHWCMLMSYDNIKCWGDCEADGNCGFVAHGQDGQVGNVGINHNTGDDGAFIPGEMLKNLPDATI